MTELEARTVCIDLDATLCDSAAGYAEALPMPGAREALRRLRESGWLVVLYTARHFNHWQTTTEWLRAHDLPYDQIVFGKPPARYYVDDRAIPFQGDWEALCARLVCDGPPRSPTSGRAAEAT